MRICDRCFTPFKPTLLQELNGDEPDKCPDCVEELREERAIKREEAEQEKIAKENRHGRI